MRIFTALMLCAAFSLQAQNADRFYATMSLQDAEELQNDLPNEVEIIKTYRNEAAVHLTDNASHKLHDRVLVHGPGYIRKTSKEHAIKALEEVVVASDRSLLAFNISEDAMVNATLPLISTQNIEDHILELEAYGTRYHGLPGGTQAAVDLKARWEAMATSYGRTDVSVRLFNHTGTNMPSVIMTITGADLPDEFVVVGGHLDSTSNAGNNNAPGADDDASGIATITEAVRALFEANFVPQRTIEVMAYAAEEIGLVGSDEIAEQYANNNVDVIAVSQFDMTLYNGSVHDVGFITDFTSGELTAFMMSLIDYYNDGGSHPITYNVSQCNYGCSDHASWNARGFLAAFPFEASFGQHNGNIHSPGDTFSVSGTASHATKFAKLCAEFLIEVAKTEGALSINEVESTGVFVKVNNGALTYDLTNAATTFTSLHLYDLQGKQVFVQNGISTEGTVSLQALQSGVYIASFGSNNDDAVSRKIIIE